MAAVSIQVYLYLALKGLAFGTFAIHFASLVQVLQTNLPPSTLLFPRSYSPNGFFVTVFCAFSASLNIMWLKELFVERDDDGCNDTPSLVAKKEDYILKHIRNPRLNDEEFALPHVHDFQQYVTVKSTYLPFYIAGNILLALSSFSAGEGLYDLSHLFVISNSVVQIFLLYVLANDVRNSVITPANFLTHLVMKTNIGLDFLLVWRTGSIINEMENPSVDQLMVISAVSLLATISSGPDPILGLSILFVLFSLIFTDEDPSTVNAASVVTWQLTFRLLAIVLIACLAIEFIISKRRNFPWLSDWNASSNRI